MENVNTNEPKIWFITGSSRGFGRVWAEAALKRGDKVAATARNIDSIADFRDKGPSFYKVAYTKRIRL